MNEIKKSLINEIMVFNDYIYKDMLDNLDLIDLSSLVYYYNDRKELYDLIKRLRGVNND